MKSRKNENHLVTLKGLITSQLAEREIKSDKQLVDKILSAPSFQTLKRDVKKYQERHTIHNERVQQLVEFILNNSSSHGTYSDLQKNWVKPTLKHAVSKLSMLTPNVPKPSIEAYRQILTLNPGLLFSITDRFLLEAAQFRLDTKALLNEVGSSTPLRDAPTFLQRFIVAKTNLQDAILKEEPSYYLLGDLTAYMEGIQIIAAYMSSKKQNIKKPEDEVLFLMGQDSNRLQEFLNLMKEINSDKDILSDSDTLLFEEYSDLYGRVSWGAHNGKQRAFFEGNDSLEEAYQRYLVVSRDFFDQQAYQPLSKKINELTTISDTVESYYFGNSLQPK